MKTKRKKKNAAPRRVAKKELKAKKKITDDVISTENKWQWLHTTPLHPLWLFIILLSIHSVGYGQIIGKSVIGCGATTVVEQNYIHHATLGQAAIGRLSTPSQDTHHVGFWYAAHAMIRQAGGVVVSLPTTQANTGDVVDIPLIATSSANIVNTTQSFVARIRYNNTLLMPLDTSLSLSFDGNDAILTLSGKITKISSILATLRFKVMLGNAPRTSLTIEAFTVGSKNAFTVIKKNGELAITDLCEAGDTTRLLHRVLAASLRSIRPNPVATTADIDFILSETGFTSLSLIDINGRTVTAIWEGQSSKGYYTKSFAVGNLSNGEYFLQLQTPNELFVKKLLIQR